MGEGSEGDQEAQHIFAPWLGRNEYWSMGNGPLHSLTVMAESIAFAGSMTREKIPDGLLLTGLFRKTRPFLIRGPGGMGTKRPLAGVM
jgi:hypothetical protein